MDDLVAVDLRTGEILEQLDQQPAETLAAALDALRSRQAELKTWQTALEHELRRRLRLRQTKRAVFGDWEVDASVSQSRVWDGAELEGVLQQLVDDGVLRAGDTADVITREPQVIGKAALRLRGRVTGDALAAIDGTWTWKERPGAVTVARSVNLLDAVPGAAEETPQVNGTAGSSEPPPGREQRAPVADRPEPGPAQSQPRHLDPEELFA